MTEGRRLKFNERLALDVPQDTLGVLQDFFFYLVNGRQSN